MKLGKTVLAILRNANQPMTGRELARCVIADRGLNQSDPRTDSTVECSLHATLERLEGFGLTRVSDEPKRSVTRNGPLSTQRTLASG